MKMKNKTKKIILGSSALLLIGTAIIGGGVFAKYISSMKTSGQMDVAKWDTTIDETVLSNTTYTADTLTSGKIAPGTEGTIDVSFIVGDNETGVDYSVKLSNVQNKPTNLYFMVDGNKYKDLDEITTLFSGNVKPGEGNKTISKTITWKWDYETGNNEDEIYDNDVIDTNEGKLAQTMSFDVTAYASQTRPAK